MGKAVFILVFAVLLITMLLHATVSVNAQSSIEWHTAQDGMQIAQSEQKLTLIFFYSERCPWCAKQKEVFTTEKVIGMTQNFVPIIGTGMLAEQYHIRGVPAMVFTNSQGEEVYRIVGYRDADTLMLEMEQALKSSDPSQTPQKQTQGQTPGFGVVIAVAAIFMCWLRRRYVKR